jgi:hypothetical protein
MCLVLLKHQSHISSWIIGDIMSQHPSHRKLNRQALSSHTYPIHALFLLHFRPKTHYHSLFPSLTNSHPTQGSSQPLGRKCCISALKGIFFSYPNHQPTRLIQSTGQLFPKEIPHTARLRGCEFQRREAGLGEAAGGFDTFDYPIYVIVSESQRKKVLETA